MIYEYDDNSSWLAIVTAVFVVEIITIITCRRVSENIVIWYDQFGGVAVIADIGIILLGFAAARYVFYCYGTLEYTPWTKAAIFSGTICGMQLFHDLFYYFVVVEWAFGKSPNGIMVFMRKYGKESKYWPLIGDSLMVISSALLAHALSTASGHVSVTVLIATLYIIPYLISPVYVFPKPQPPGNDDDPAEPKLVMTRHRVGGYAL